tara:strand:+ start:12754 stop:13785 length:1032 start_codon:yes stop_codon:yes gene_type:complete
MPSSRIDRLNVDLYKIVLNDDGVMTIDIGGDNGILNINGNLNVTGTTTTVGSSDLVVSDNTITVNGGESGAGITLGTAGIIVDRGSYTNAAFLYDESLTTYLNGNVLSNIGAWTTEHADGKLAGIYTTSIISGEGNDLNLLSGQTTGVVSVTGTTDYEKQVFPYTGSNITFNGSNANRLQNPYDNDILPNIQSVIDYVRSYHLYNWQDAIKAPTPDGNTSVNVFDTEGGDPTSKATIVVDGLPVVEVFSTQTNIEEIKIEDASISPLNINGNLTLNANGSGSILTGYPVELEKSLDPTAPADGVKLYAKEEADGGTGIFFINENSTTDELISRNKALLYSIIF